MIKDGASGRQMLEKFRRSGESKNRKILINCNRIGVFVGQWKRVAFYLHALGLGLGL